MIFPVAMVLVLCACAPEPPLELRDGEFNIIYAFIVRARAVQIHVE